jgi:signal transduction histidine kinase
LKYDISSFRLRLAVAIFCAVTIPALIAGWFMIRQAESALLQEKERKLLTIAQQLDMMMPGTYDDYLGVSKDKLTRQQKISRLHANLATVTEEVAKRNPGVGVGYYAREVDAVITYGPEREMHEKIGLSIAKNHPGQKVLATGKPMVYTGPQVRGDIMNAMIPLIRNGSIIGYVWANETTSSIKNQLGQIERKLFLLFGAGMFFSIGMSFFITNRVGGDIDRMIAAIEKTNSDFRSRMPNIKGVLGKVPFAFNSLMDRLAESQEHNQRLEESMRRADRLQALGQLATGMAHEIRNPLASIKAFAQIIEENIEPTDGNKEYLSIIVSETDRLNRLIEQMLLFGRPSPGQEEQVNLDKLIGRSLILFEHECRKKQIILIQDIEPALIYADPHLLQQVIVNVLLNAIQATPVSGTLRISCGEHQNIVRLSIFNSGSFISDEHREAIFNPFFTTKEQGTGLGLSVTQNIVHIYDGTIQVINKEDGVEFVIEFSKSLSALENRKGRYST